MESRKAHDIKRLNEEYQHLQHSFDLAIERGAQFEEVKSMYSDMKMVKAIIELLSLQNLNRE